MSTRSIQQVKIPLSTNFHAFPIKSRHQTTRPPTNQLTEPTWIKKNRIQIVTNAVCYMMDTSSRLYNSYTDAPTTLLSLHNFCSATPSLQLCSDSHIQTCMPPLLRGNRRLQFNITIHNSPSVTPTPLLKLLCLNSQATTPNT